MGQKQARQQGTRETLNQEQARIRGGKVIKEQGLRLKKKKHAYNQQDLINSKKA